MRKFIIHGLQEHIQREILKNQELSKIQQNKIENVMDVVSQSDQDDEIAVKPKKQKR